MRDCSPYSEVDFATVTEREKSWGERIPMSRELEKLSLSGGAIFFSVAIRKESLVRDVFPIGGILNAAYMRNRRRAEEDTEEIFFYDAV